MELILKSNRGLHVRLSADDAEGLLKVSQLCELLEISYTGVRARIFRGETVEQAVHHFWIRKVVVMLEISTSVIKIPSPSLWTSRVLRRLKIRR